MAAVHLVWDWNGTLFDDRNLLLDTVGQTLSAEGFPALTRQQLWQRFCRPLRRFFEQACGRHLDTETWEHMEATFRRLYGSNAGAASLAAGAREALAYGQGIAMGQYLLSLSPQGELLRLTDKCRIVGYFDEIRGRTRPDEDKAALLTALINRRSLDPNLVVHIGDALDDAAAARAVGAKPVLVAGASLEVSDPARQQRLSPHVATSLGQAVQCARELVTAEGDTS